MALIETIPKPGVSQPVSAPATKATIGAYLMVVALSPSVM